VHVLTRFLALALRCQVDELKELLEDIAKRVPDYKGAPVGQMIEAVTLPPISYMKAPSRLAIAKNEGMVLPRHVHR
jgi:hypothetical protein